VDLLLSSHRGKGCHPGSTITSLKRTYRELLSYSVSHCGRKPQTSQRRIGPFGRANGRINHCSPDKPETPRRTPHPEVVHLADRSLRTYRKSYYRASTNKSNPRTNRRTTSLKPHTVNKSLKQIQSNLSSIQNQKSKLIWPTCT
jgi:hypothetical protein